MGFGAMDGAVPGRQAKRALFPPDEGDVRVAVRPGSDTESAAR